jgi:hypothetical protein
MLTLFAAIFWFGFAAIGWIVVAVLTMKQRKDGNDPPSDPPDDPPPSPAAAAFMDCRRAQRARVGVPHALEPPWAEPQPS